MSEMHPVQLAAFDYAKGARHRETKAKNEKTSLEERIAALEIEIELNQAAADRLGTYSLHADGVLQCPRCWIVQEIRADLTPVPSNNGDDVFRCTHCRDEFIIPAL